MNRLNLADIIHHCYQKRQIQASPRQWQVLHHLMDCRTAKMGGGIYQCSSCHSRWLWHHSCRDRHCPQCQSQASQNWCDKQKQQLLPVPYFHMVFTLPHELNSWVPRYGELIYRLLFQASWQALRGLSERKLKGQPGMTAVLHTWGQKLTRHIHLHCLIPAGVLKNGRKWQKRDKDYLLPVKALSNRFRGIMVSLLREAEQQGLLMELEKKEISGTLNQLMRKPWVVYSKSAIRYRETLIQYLARYTHRIGLSNHRLQRWENDRITLACYDYKHSRSTTLQLTPVELVRRYLLHVLPKGFMRIRHYGYLSNAIKARSLVVIRKTLAKPEPIKEAKPEPTKPRCPECGCDCIHCLGEVRKMEQKLRLDNTA